jgi:hypothetical protein
MTSIIENVDKRPTRFYLSYTTREKIEAVFLRSLSWVLRFLILYLVSKTLIESELNNRIPGASKLLLNLYTNGFVIYFF